MRLGQLERHRQAGQMTEGREREKERVQRVQYETLGSITKMCTILAGRQLRKNTRDEDETKG